MNLKEIYLALVDWVGEHILAGAESIVVDSHTVTVQA